MILRLLLPWWAIALIFAPLFALAIWQMWRSRSAVRFAWLRRAFLVLLVAVMVACPAIPEPTQQKWITTVEVYLVVDITGSMAAEDYGPDAAPRLDGVKADMVSITNDLPGARYSVITFGTDSIKTLPLTSDAKAVKSLADTLHQEVSTQSSGSNVGRALPALTRALQQSQEERPQNVRLVYFLSDGENTDHQDTPSFADLKPMIDGGAVMGYGTEQGGKMKVYLGEVPPDPEAPYIQDPKTGTDAISRIDEATLKQIGDEMGVTYTHRTEPGPTTSLTSGIDSQLIAAEARRPLVTYRDVVWPVAALVALLLLWEVWYLATHLVAFRDDKTRRIAPPARQLEDFDPLSDEAEQVFVGVSGMAGVGSGPGGTVGAAGTASGTGGPSGPVAPGLPPSVRRRR